MSDTIVCVNWSMIRMTRYGTEMISWLASYPKSGNTWVKLLLSAYRNNGYVDINDPSMSNGDTIAYYYQLVSPLSMETLGGNGKFLLRPAALLHQIVANPYRPLIMKTHSANVVVPGLLTLIPPAITCRALYIVRDPRDVVSSLSDHMGKTKAATVEFMNEKEAAAGDNENKPIPSILSTWSTHVKSWTTEEAYPVLIIRYEDLLANPVTELIKMLEFLEYEADTDRAARSVEVCELAKLRKQEDEEGFREGSANASRFFNKGGSRWKDELDPALARQIEEDHGEMMLRLGYEISTA